jgi:hypothetical protein
MFNACLCYFCWIQVACVGWCSQSSMTEHEACYPPWKVYLWALTLKLLQIYLPFLMAHHMPLHASSTSAFFIKLSLKVCHPLVRYKVHCPSQQPSSGANCISLPHSTVFFKFT